MKNLAFCFLWDEKKFFKKNNFKIFGTDGKIPCIVYWEEEKCVKNVN